MKNVIETVERILVESVEDPTLKFELETLRSFQYDNSTITTIELRSTKFNLIKLEGQICKARRIEVFQSGKSHLWYSYPKGKSFSQNSYAIEVTFSKI